MGISPPTDCSPVTVTLLSRREPEGAGCLEHNASKGRSRELPAPDARPRSRQGCSYLSSSRPDSSTIPVRTKKVPTSQLAAIWLFDKAPGLFRSFRSPCPDLHRAPAECSRESGQAPKESGGYPGPQPSLP